jgi:HTH-type transcriptional regulator, sugar sensing transcriptional regulator
MLVGLSSPFMTTTARTALEELGFTALEAATYVALLQTSPATAYQVAKHTGKPVANTYKAIASLAAKGAIIRDDGGKQLCRAVEPVELLERIHRQQIASTARASKLLADIAPETSDTRVYQLTDTAAVYARARAMLKRAEQLATIEAFPVPLAELRADLVATARRKVRITAQCYSAEKIPGVVTVLFNRAAELLASEPGQLMCLTVDRREVLLALISHDDKHVLQAVYSASSFLASILFAYMASEMCISAAMEDPEFTANFRGGCVRVAKNVGFGPGPMILMDKPKPKPKPKPY